MRPLAFLLLYCFTSLLPVQADTLFESLQALDGRSYSGRMTFPDDPAHEMNQPMTIIVRVKSEDEIRVPFQVGDDSSRTWVLTRTSAGVQLKHDHRHPDGTPDELTNYGGLAIEQGLGSLLVFPADQETKNMLPEAAGNVWTLRLSPDGRQLWYYLERDRKPRFEAVFNLTP